MKTFVATLFTVAALGFALPAQAEKMSGQEVAGLFSQGKIAFKAGSRWQTKPNGRYVFRHGSAKEEGTFKILANGDVHILDERSGKTIKFYFDKESDGIPALIYLNGPGKGKRYPIKP
ncbi:MAG: hypothetical protein N4A61_14115 [Pelagimonas sp.]|nr:hypothetical protein [Pelagimonas sp.]